MLNFALHSLDVALVFLYIYICKHDILNSFKNIYNSMTSKILEESNFNTEMYFMTNTHDATVLSSVPFHNI